MPTIASLHVFTTAALYQRIREQREWLIRLHQGMELLREAARRLIPEWDTIEPHKARWIRLGAEVRKQHVKMGKKDFEDLGYLETVLAIRTAADMKAGDRAAAQQAQAEELTRQQVEELNRQVKELTGVIQDLVRRRDDPQSGPAGPNGFQLDQWAIKGLTPIENAILDCLWRNGIDVPVKRSAVMVEVYGPQRIVKAATVDQHKKNLSRELFAQTDGQYEIQLKSGSYTLRKLR